jgi:2-polyprenyl-3-methyl-5-hydroxy-6-metoxy-1,4-benzoquinol methylase
VQTTVSDADLKARHRAMWASGDYPSMVETFLLPLGPRLVAACGIAPGMRVLDVAAGTGNASLPAAQGGADVTASDLTPELLEDGRRRAQGDGLVLEWVEADPSACRSTMSRSTSSCRLSARCSRPTTAPSPESSCGSAARAARSGC